MKHQHPEEMADKTHTTLSAATASSSKNASLSPNPRDPASLGAIQKRADASMIVYESTAVVSPRRRTQTNESSSSNTSSASNVFSTSCPLCGTTLRTPIPAAASGDDVVQEFKDILQNYTMTSQNDSKKQLAKKSPILDSRYFQLLEQTFYNSLRRDHDHGVVIKRPRKRSLPLPYPLATSTASAHDDQTTEHESHIQDQKGKQKARETQCEEGQTDEDVEDTITTSGQSIPRQWTQYTTIDQEDISQEHKTTHTTSTNTQASLPTYFDTFFTPITVLGRGATSQVLLATHHISDHTLGTFAIKVIPYSTSSYLSHALKEIELITKLELDHTNLVKVRHVWSQPYRITKAGLGPEVECLFVLMDWCRGGSLESWMEKRNEELDLVQTVDGPNGRRQSCIKRRKRIKASSSVSISTTSHIDEDNAFQVTLQKRRHSLSRKQIHHIFAQIIRGIQYLHQRKLAHRDLKASNILLMENDSEYPTAVIGDLGNAQVKGESRGEIGTVDWMPPECFLNISEDECACVEEDAFKVDSWSTGLILYYLFYGTLPYANADDIDLLITEIQHFDPRSRKELEGLGPYSVLLKGLLERDPDRRWTVEMAMSLLEEIDVTDIEDNRVVTSLVKSPVDSKVIGVQDVEPIPSQRITTIDTHVSPHFSAEAPQSSMISQYWTYIVLTPQIAIVIGSISHTMSSLVAIVLIMVAISISQAKKNVLWRLGGICVWLIAFLFCRRIGVL